MATKANAAESSTMILASHKSAQRMMDRIAVDRVGPDS
jgi:hypothetical protein